MNMITVERQDQVAIVKLCRGVTNALDLRLVNELSGTLQAIVADEDLRSLVLTSANEKFFCIGFDIPHLYVLDRDAFRGFYQAINRLCLDLYTLPMPTVAAISGHAIAGGCILALCCDYRFIAEGRKLMGLNEIKLGVPVPYPADLMLRRLVGGASARDIMEGGEFYPPETCARLGLVDNVVAPEQLIPKAIERASVLGAMPRKAFVAIKQNRTQRVRTAIEKHLSEAEERFMDCWYSAEARERLKAAMAKF